MKHIFWLILLLIFSFSGKTQEKTYIYGTLNNCKDVEIHILTEKFNAKSLQETRVSRYIPFDKTIKGNVQGDSIFFIEVEDIIRPFTACLLYLDSETSTVVLSPGDSLRIDIDYWAFKTGNQFSGDGAEINQYVNEKRRRFVENGRYEKVFSEDPEDDRLAQLQSFYEDQQAFLEYWNKDGILDEHFFSLEKRRIKYLYNYGLLASVPAWLPNDEGKIQLILDELDGLELNDEEAMFASISYRRLIRSYFDFINNPYDGLSSVKLKDQLALGEKYLSGTIKSFYCWSIIHDAIYNADSGKEKKTIIAHSERLIKDTVLVELLMNEKDRLVRTQYQDRFWFQSGFLGGVLLVLVFILFLVFRYFIKIAKEAAKKEVEHKPLLWLVSVLAIGLVVPATNLIFKHPIKEIWPLLSSLLFYGLVLGFGRFVSPFLLKRKYYQFVIGTILVISTYYLGLRYVLVSFGPWSEASMIGMVRKWFVVSASTVLLVSLLVDYLLYLNKKGRTFSDFIRILGRKSELIVLGAICLFVYFMGALSLETILGLRNFVLSNLGLLIFFVFAFWFGPSFFKKKRWFLFVSGTIITFLLSESVIVINEAWFLQAKLLSSGIDAGFNLYLPGVNGYVFLASVPGILYALVRDRLIQKSQAGFSLYRKKEAELQQLRSQVNPHFLFNSLNTVYAQALKDKNEKTAESIAKLSNLMRYLVDDMDKDEIPIRKEIAYIDDYIKLQSARSSVSHDISLQVDLSEGDQDQMIAPMLMIPFVENAFKHGINPNKKSRLHIVLSQEINQFRFEIENSVDPEFEGFEKEKGFGIGIPNVRKRLEYQYSGRHRISIEDTETYFKVVLTLELTNK